MNQTPFPQEDRRRFLAQSAAALTATLGAPRGLFAEPAASDRLGLAVIGCGGISRHHAPHLPPMFDVRLVCDVDRNHGERYLADFAPHARLISRYEEAIAADAIDALLICTPDHWHAKIAIEALRAGKDVYCEKPLTLTIEEGALVREAVAETGRVFQVGTQQRSSPDFQTAVGLAQQGRIGKLRRITAAIGAAPIGGPFAAEPAPEELDWDRWLGPAPKVTYLPQRCHGNFRWWYEYSGGKMSDWGAHHVDIALWGAGFEESGEVSIDPLSVVHSPPLVDGMPSTSDHFNTAATFHVRCYLHDGIEFEIRDTAPDLGFENGIMFEGEEGRFFVNRGKLTGQPVDDLKENPLPAGTLESLRKGRPLMGHMANFFHACHDRGPTISDADSHVRHLNICHAANISLRTGAPLIWRPESNSFTDEALSERWLARKKRAGYEINA